MKLRSPISKAVSKKLKVLIAAGGTGGHLFPAQQLSELLLKEGDCEILFAGHRLTESPFFEKEKVVFEEIAAAPIQNWRSFFRSVWKGFWQSVSCLRRFGPDVVVGFGSFHSFPVLLASVVLRKKIVLFEANCLLGKVNRLLLPAAERIALQFPIQNRKIPKGVFVPLLPWKEKRPGVLTVLTKEEARAFFGLSPDRLTVLVFGGSQGAQFLNQIFPRTAELIEKQGVAFQVIHLTGKGGSVSYGESRLPLCVKPFEKEMELAYLASDLAVCRSGAGTIAELIRFQVPAILIPYPFATDDHQKVNGKYLAQTIGGARMLLQREASAENLALEIAVLIGELEIRKEALRKDGEKNEERKGFADLVKRIGKSGR